MFTRFFVFRVILSFPEKSQISELGYSLGYKFKGMGLVEIYGVGLFVSVVVSFFRMEGWLALTLGGIA